MKKLLLISSGIIFILTLVQVMVSNSLSTNGTTLGSLEDKISAYQKENLLLKEKLLTESALTNLATTAAQLGFASVKSPINLSAFFPLAQKP